MTAVSWPRRLLLSPISLTTTRLVILAGAFFAIAANASFMSAVMTGRDLHLASSWAFAATMLVALAALHALLLSLVLVRRIAKPLLGTLIVLTALASYFMQRLGIYLDPTMLRNVVMTDPAEASELFSWGMLPHLLLFAGLPLLFLSRVKLTSRPWRRALAWRLSTILGSAAVLVGALLFVYQDFSAQMRNQKELRYLATPANFIFSTFRVAFARSREAQAPRTQIGLDAKLSESWSTRTKPVLFVLAIGETARAANWGLNGYARQTTPELAKQGVINFRDVTSCGTNTETSLPCMFAPVGRRDYDEKRIRTSESLLHLLNRAGFQVLWRDNQSGCKGVCDGLPAEQLDSSKLPEWCDGSRCLDEVLLQGLDTVARDARGNLVVVLHMLGNHGPSYFKRYPESFRRYVPTCDTKEFSQCTREQIVNAYDNALLYTDHVLKKTVDFLSLQKGRYDTALVYISDHGESLGEKGLYLHGIPYAIAPDEQTKVPMVWWLSTGFVASSGLDVSCLKVASASKQTHDNLFHTVLGLLAVTSGEYAPGLDISRPCRR
jgi:lipid A ethanolaminephosphotransferase